MQEPNVPTSSPKSVDRDRASSERLGGAGQVGMFAEPTAVAGRSFPVAAVALAVVAVLVLVASLAFFGRHRAAANAAAGQASAAYAANVRLGGLEMSESTSLSGGKVTYVDGKITNAGTATVTGVTVAVSFPSDNGQAQVETVPVYLIRMRQPEIDTEPMSAEPLAAGATKEFRLIFEDIKPDWNQQTPAIRVVGVAPQ